MTRPTSGLSGDTSQRANVSRSRGASFGSGCRTAGTPAALAAEGLRSGDFNGAHQALLELERTTSGGERDAARLARAQLLSSHGRGSEALALSRDLEAYASSSSVRDKARDLRERLTKNVEQDRSPSASPGINQP